MTNEKEIIRLALEENNKQAWKALEEMLVIFYPDRDEVNNFLNAVHQIATTDNYTSLEDLLYDLKSDQ